jgi:hypothetical protein
MPQASFWTVTSMVIVLPIVTGFENVIFFICASLFGDWSAAATGEASKSRLELAKINWKITTEASRFNLFSFLLDMSNNIVKKIRDYNRQLQNITKQSKNKV